MCCVSLFDLSSQQWRLHHLRLPPTSPLILQTLIVAVRIAVIIVETIETETRSKYGKRADPPRKNAVDANTPPIPLILLTPIPPVRAQIVSMRSHEGTRSMKSQRRLRIRNEARVIVINGIRTEKERLAIIFSLRFE